MRILMGIAAGLIGSAVAAAQPAPPRAVIGPTYVNIGLAWDANVEADLAGYKVYFGTASRAYGAPIGLAGTPAAPTFELTGFAGGTYYFAVTAYNTAGRESGYSNEVSATVLPNPPPPTVGPAGPQGPAGPIGPQGPPGPPGTGTTPIQGPHLVNATSTSAYLSFRSAVPARARIEYQTAGGPFNSLVIDQVEVTDHFTRIGGLQAGKVYSYTVICETAAGQRLEATGTFRTR